MTPSFGLPEGESPFRSPSEGRWTCKNADGFDDVLDAVRWACSVDSRSGTASGPA